MPAKTLKTLAKNSENTALKPAKAAYTKAQIVAAIAVSQDLPKAHVEAVLDGLTDVIGCHIQKGAVGYFTLPGVIKVQTQIKPAIPARRQTNPFTGKKPYSKPSLRLLVLKSRR